jgi:glycerate-2-kinase
VLKEGNIIKKYLIEIKPSSQTRTPKASKNKKASSLLYEQTQWIVNQAKWEAAKAYAKKRGFEFIILTEKELFPKDK